MLFGFINIFTGIVFCLLAAPIALLVLVIACPFVMALSGFTGVKDMMLSYPKDTVHMLQYGFRISNNGLKRIRVSA